MNSSISENSKTNEKKSSNPNHPLETISASAIRDYQTCQKLFYYRHILKMRLPTKPIGLIFGSAFHKGVEAYYDKEDPIKAFKKLFRPAMIEPFDPMKYDIAYDQGIYLMEQWKLMAPDLHADNIISTKGESEIRFEQFWKDPVTREKLPVISTGRYDRITYDNCILEFKTSSKPYNQEKVDEAIQGDFYYFNYTQANKWPPKRIVYIIFIKGRKKNPIQVIDKILNEKQLITTFSTVKTILNELVGKQERNFSYGTDFMHKYCDCTKYEEQLLV